MTNFRKTSGVLQSYNGDLGKCSFGNVLSVNFVLTYTLNQLDTILYCLYVGVTCTVNSGAFSTDVCLFKP